MRRRKSTLLVPGAVERLIEKATSFDVDVVVLDLEDSVPPAERAKQRARDNVVTALREYEFKAEELNVRINGPKSNWFEADIRAAVEAGANSITIPHTYGAEDVITCEQAILDFTGGRELGLLLAVETPATLLELEAIARRCKMISALYVGPNDFSYEIGSSALVEALISGNMVAGGDEHLSWMRSKIIAVAAAAGWQAIDAVAVADAKDLSAVRAAMMRSRRMGFDGAAMLFPSHIDIANQVFGVSESELGWALQVISCYETCVGDDWPKLDDGRTVIQQHYEVAIGVRTRAEAERASS